MSEPLYPGGAREVPFTIEVKQVDDTYALGDPSTVGVEHISPAGTVTGLAVTNDGVGLYHVTFEPTSSDIGINKIRVTTTGPKDVAQLLVRVLDPNN